MSWFIFFGWAVVWAITMRGWMTSRAEARRLQQEVIRLRVFSQRDPWQRSFTR